MWMCKGENAPKLMMLFVCQLDARDHLSWVSNLFLSLIINYHEILSNQNNQIGTFFIYLEGGLYLLVNLSTKCLQYQWAGSGGSSKLIGSKQIWMKYWLLWQKGIWLDGLGLSWTTTKSLVCNAYYAWFGRPGSEMENVQIIGIYLALKSYKIFYFFFCFTFEIMLAGAILGF